MYLDLSLRVPTWQLSTTSWLRGRCGIHLHESLEGYVGIPQYDLPKTCVFGVHTSRSATALQALHRIAVFTKGGAVEFVCMDKAFEVQAINELSLVVSNSISNGVLYPLSRHGRS